MNEQEKNALNAFKQEGKAMLKAVALMLIGGLMLLGAGALYFLPLLDGEKPNLVLALILVIPGAIIEIIGDWKYSVIMEQTKKRIAAQKAEK